MEESFLGDSTNVFLNFFIAGALLMLSVLVIADITSRRQQRKNLLKGKSQTLTDALTGALTRAGILAVAPKLLGKTKNTTFSLLALVDLDSFKQLNDSVGHPAGDSVLRHFASTLRIEAKDTGVVGRLGGDEFIVLAGGLDSEERAKRLLKDLSSALSGYAEYEGVRIPYSASMGAVITNRSHKKYEQLIVQADTNMYEAKKHAQQNPTVTVQLDRVSDSPVTPKQVKKNAPKVAAQETTQTLILSDALIQASRTSILRQEFVFTENLYQSPKNPEMVYRFIRLCWPTNLKNSALNTAVPVDLAGTPMSAEVINYLSRNGLASDLLWYTLSKINYTAAGNIVVPLAATAALDPSAWASIEEADQQLAGNLVLAVSDATAQLIADLDKETWENKQPALLLDGYGDTKSTLAILWLDSAPIAVRFTQAQIKKADQNTAQLHGLKAAAAACKALQIDVLAESESVTGILDKIGVEYTLENSPAGPASQI